MKIVLIADTHGTHHEIKIPDGDMIIHAGDITDFGTKEEVIDFLDWFEKLNHPYKLFIGGNHDIYLDENPVDLLELIPSNVTYLNNSGITINGFKIWGSPTTPDFTDWAFGKHRKEMELHWKYLPKAIDILITHTPPLGILDVSSRHVSLGCEYLLKKVQLLKPKFHIFGHIHASYGLLKSEATTFVNAASIHSQLEPINAPIVIHI